MGQKTHPYGFRLGITKPWRSRWFAKRDYSRLLHEDLKLKRDLKKQLQHAEKDAASKLSPEKKKRYQELEKQIAAAEPKRPAPLPAAMALTDLGRQAPPTHRLSGGDWRKPRQEVQPGFPEFLGAATPDTSLADSSNSSAGMISR